MMKQGGLTSDAEKYLGALNDHLAMRGVGEKRSGEHVEELAGHLLETGLDPAEEFGSADEYAAALVEADEVPHWFVFAVPVATYFTFVAAWVSIVLALRWTEPAVLKGNEFSGVLVVALGVAIGQSVVSARLRDRLRGTKAATPTARWFVIRQCLNYVGAVGIVIVADIALTNRQIEFGSVDSWVPALFSGVLAALLATFVMKRGGLKPKFSKGSNLKATWLHRWRIKLSEPGK